MTDRLFVYGTLRSESSHPLARRLQMQAKFLGKASAEGSLYDLGRYPGALFHANATERITGEVYALRNPARLFATLDTYEAIEEGASAFKRLIITVRLDKGGVLKAWSYGLSGIPRLARPIESGDFILHARAKTRRPLRR